ncbi:MAG: toxin-antitoxin system protein [Acidobacteria bacterium]|nr:toxin-antitoxin system protein [Acidobacteriota bacterium]
MPSAELLTVHVSAHAQHTIRALAQKTARSDQEVVERAVEELRRKLLFEEANASFAVLQQQSETWAEIEREQNLWDAASADGLEREDWSEYAHSKEA